MTSLRPILLVEDNQNDIVLSLKALQKSRVTNEICVTRDGDEALDFLYCRGAYEGREGGNPAVIFLDMKMPRVDGLEVLKTIKNDPRLKSIPVVMLTCSSEEADLARSYKLGVNAYVVKPVDFKQFFDAVQQLGIFWAIMNEPPPSSVPKPAEERQKIGT